jgi:hypothetical protein
MYLPTWLLPRLYVRTYRPGTTEIIMYLPTLYYRGYYVPAYLVLPRLLCTYLPGTTY